MSRLAEHLAIARRHLDLPPAEEARDRCSFCGRPRARVTTLVPGFDSFICDGCVRHAHDVVLGALSAAPAPAGGAPGAHVHGPGPGPATDPPGGGPGVAERVEHVKSMLELVDETRDESVRSLHRLVETLLAYLDSVPSDKLILTLPWDRLDRLGQALDALREALAEGAREHDELTRR